MLVCHRLAIFCFNSLDTLIFFISRLFCVVILYLSILHIIVFVFLLILLMYCFMHECIQGNFNICFFFLELSLRKVFSGFYGMKIVGSLWRFSPPMNTVSMHLRYPPTLIIFFLGLYVLRQILINVKFYGII